TARSARVATAVVARALLFAETGSTVVVATFAVLLMVEPSAALGLTWTTRVNVPVAPGAKVGILKLIVPVLPTVGVLPVQPAAGMNDTKVVLAGTSSVSET